ncbi:phosphatase PAP2 family protein [Pseudomonas sp. MBLB4136]|uniref:phosphatase PAP2 family protein n=1 Tax=Pseudomonas sp. MBLB4136 TaxID=3451558 RepID=UPI003F74D8B3
MNRRVLCCILTFLPGIGLAAPAPDASRFSWEHLGAAAAGAAREPGSWGPLAAAVVIAAGGWDRQWQHSAAKHQYLFGEDAEERSNDLMAASSLLYGVSALLAKPADVGAAQVWEWRASNLAVMLADKALVDGLVGEWKSASGRDRPDGIADDAFPSRHSATVATQTSLTRRNLEHIDLDPDLRQLASLGLYGVDGLTALARIEADKHYPTDTLVGMALGSFLANFSYRLLLESPPSQDLSFALQPSAAGLALSTRLRF